MAISRSVQFDNAESVIAAYESRGVAPWSMWSNSQFLFKYEGKDIGEGAAMLAEHLKIIAKSPAVYTLKVYEDLGKSEKIKSNTPDDGSFNFRFAEISQGYQPGGQAINELLTEVRTLKLQLADLQKEEEEESEVDEPLGIFGHIMKMPGMDNVLAGILGKVVGVLPGTPQAIAGVPGGVADLNEAVQILLVKDPHFEQHLIKLATLARDKPETFKQIVSMMQHV